VLSWQGLGRSRRRFIKVGMVAEATCVPSRGRSFRWWLPLCRLHRGLASSGRRATDRGAETLYVLHHSRFHGADLQGRAGRREPGSSCVANAYTSNHELITSGKIGSLKSFALHVVDATGLVHALLLRIQALLLPIQTLVLGGH